MPRSTEMRSPSCGAVAGRDPVHDHRVRREAERGREALVALRGRDAAVGDGCAPRRSGRARASRRRARDARRRAASVSATSSPARAMPLDLLAADLRMITRASPEPRGECSISCEDLVDRPVGVDADDVAVLRPVVLDERRRLARRTSRAAAAIASGVSSERLSSSARFSIRSISCSRSGTWNSNTTSSSRPSSCSISSSASACASVRGKPSSTNPGSVSPRESRSRISRIMSSSETRSPRS